MEKVGLILFTAFWSILTFAVVIGLFSSMNENKDISTQLLWTIVAVVIEVILIRGIYEKDE